MIRDRIKEYMTLKQKLSEDLKDALKKKEEVRVSSLRMVLAAVANKEIEIRKKDIGLSDEEVLEVLLSEVKKRKDSVVEFKKGGREDLVAREEEELAALKGYLPEEMPDEEIARVVKDGIRECGAGGMSDFGKVMKVIMPVLKGRADGDRVSAVVREALASLKK